MEFALVDDTLGLAFASGNGFGVDKFDIGIDAQHGFERVNQFSFAAGNGSEIIREHFVCHFDLHFKCIAVFHTIHHNLVICRVTSIDKNCFNLGREDVDAFYNKHVITATHGLAHFNMGSAT